MSILNTAPIRVWPAAADNIPVPVASTVGVFGPWTEIIPANAVAVPIQLAGLCISMDQVTITTGIDNLVVEFGTGGVGDEVAVSAPLLVNGGQTNTSQQIFMFPVPIGNIPANARLSIRFKSVAAGISYPLALMYYRELTADTALDLPYAYSPDGTSVDWPISGAIVTPNVTPWANSAWAELAAVIQGGSQLVGLAPEFPGDYYNVDWEMDIGIGSLGSEVVVGTLRSEFPNAGALGFNNTWLPALYPLTTASRISYRLRKSGTSATPLRSHLVYIAAPTPVVSGLTVDCATTRFIVVGGSFFAGVSIVLTGPGGVSESFALVSQTATQIVLGSISPVLVNGATYCVTVGDSTLCAALSCAGGFTIVEKFIRRERRAPHLSNEQKILFYPAIQVETRPGIGHAVAPGVDPLMMLSISFDGGYTWTPEVQMNAGEIGQYRRRMIARQLGFGRDTVFRVVVSDPNTWDLVAAYLDPPPIAGRH